MKVFFADCDQFDNSQTGYFATAEEAERQFWEEQTFSAAERQRVRVYTREVEVNSEVRAHAAWLAAQGSPSPALGIEAQ